MNTSNGFEASFALAIVLVLPLSTNGCGGGDDPISSAAGASSAVCCTEFEPGASIDADIGGSARAQVAAQAVADFSGSAAASVDSLTTSCRSIAQQLDAPQAEQLAAETATNERTKLELWCRSAVTAIGSFKAKAGGTLDVNVAPARCDVSVTAKASCQAKCSGSATCDVRANPPTCMGGSLEVACRGTCTAKAGATLHCQGRCSAECKGTCTAQGGVQCSGRCDGTCKGAAQGGTGTGIQADGTCDGTCEGTCDTTAPGAACSGSCSGECAGNCTGSAEASATCDGDCDGDFEPIACDGGTLKGGCQVDAQCDGNCDASVSAKAECNPPAVRVTLAGAADAVAAGKLQAVFEANLGLIYAFQARLEGMAALTATITGNADVIVDIDVACIPVVIAAAVGAVQDVQASASAAASIIAAAK